jgi:AcrR family transcriptional regulator
MRALPGHASRIPDGHAPITRDKLADGQRQRILRATGELVAKRGYHGTTVELIVRRARVGYATFYKNFEGKEDCFLALFDTAVATAAERMDAAMVAAGQEWPGRVGAALRALFELIVEEPMIARACLVESLTAGPRATARYEAATKGMVPILRPGRRFNPRKGELPGTLEDTLAGGILWIAYQRLIVNEADHLPSLLPETLEFALSPYLGEAEAVRFVKEITVPKAQPA